LKKSETLSIPFGTCLSTTPDFGVFESKKFTYVDKTDLIYDSIKTSPSCIISRPRRFGKSLLLSTIEAIASKNKSLKKLKIRKKIEKGIDSLHAHPVIDFDFSQTSTTSLESYIMQILKPHALKLKLNTHLRDLDYILSNVLQKYCEKKKRPFILVDEYDFPVWVEDKNKLQ
jgi:Predicted AAA-ATPase